MERARRFASVGGWLYVASGLALVALSFAPPWLGALTRLAVPEAAAPDRALALYAGVAGGLTVGLGVAVVAAVREAHTSGVACVAQGVFAWFVVDTLASLGHGSWQNAIGNTAFLLLAAPLWSLRRASAKEGRYAAPAR
ncbi:MAG: hypothetical protein IPG50_14110 [Myxococcales bacterium]|nr:hypothetical protein [Myxococcales bacterium]